MGRRPEIGNVQLYPDRPLNRRDRNGYVLKFYCPLRQTRVRRNCGTRDRREARRILRECRERLLNGKYIESGGAITVAMEQAAVRARLKRVLTDGSPPAGSTQDVGESSESQDVAAPTWHTCLDHYTRHLKVRVRDKTLADATSRIEIARLILDAERAERGLAPSGPITEYATLATLERLQERMLAGDEGRYDARAPMSVNTMIGALMAFFNYCERHGWIPKVPPLERLDMDEVMKGRPITSQEFEHLLATVPEVVGDRPAASWKFVLHILWESAFRVGDVMNFSWDDERRIHPVWREGERLPTLMIPSSQKNKKVQEIPMLPGLETLLQAIPKEQRKGWVANPLSLDGRVRLGCDWFQPTRDDLVALVRQHNNSAIARACGVTETAVRKWLKQAGIRRSPKLIVPQGDLTSGLIAAVRSRAEEIFAQPTSTRHGRLTTEYVGRVISAIGEQAGIVVQRADEETGKRIKYASAHDIRRGCAMRLINAGVSAETLMVVMRHKDFRTTQKFYGAMRAAQSAAAEVHHKLVAILHTTNQPEAEMGKLPQLNPEELRKLKALLNSL